MKKNRFKLNFSASSLSFTGFLFLLFVSWFHIHQGKQSSYEHTHQWLQEQFQNVISDYVENHYPSVREITFHKVYTKKTDEPSVIKIFFSYTLTTKDTTSSDLSLDGEALLTQKISSKDWMLSQFKVTKSFLEFSEPFYIKASTNDPL